MEQNNSLLSKFISFSLGLGIGKFIVVIAMPILTRLYRPEDFAQLAIFNSVVVLIAPIASLRIMLAIPVTKSHNDAVCFLKLSLTSSFCFSIVTGLLLLGLKNMGINDLNVLGQLLYIVPISVFLVSAIESLAMFATRGHRFKLLAKNAVSQSIVEAIAKITTFFLSINGLILGQLAQQVASVICLTKKQKKYFKKRNNEEETELKVLLIQLLPIVKYRIPDQIVTSLSIALPILYVTSFFESRIIGQVSLAITAIALPINLLTSGLGKVILAEISTAVSQKVKKTVYTIHDTILKTFLLGLIPACILFVFGHDIFSLVFGKDWYQAGAIAGSLSILLLFEISFRPSLQILTGLSLHKHYLVISSIRLLASTLSFYTGHQFNLRVEDVFLLYASVVSLVFFFSYLYVTKVLKKLSEYCS